MRSWLGIYNNTLMQIIIIFVFLINFPSSSVLAWDNCPFGYINESYPGSCGRYIDTDNDNICDLSQSSPDSRTNTILDQNINQQQGTINNNAGLESNKVRLNYYFLPIFVVLCVLYSITLILSKKKKIKSIIHRKIWNVLLLITFLVSGIFGIILAIFISYGIRLSFYSDLLFWHVEFGIAMAIISIFHIGWHWKYYKKILIKH